MTAPQTVPRFEFGRFISRKAIAAAESLRARHEIAIAMRDSWDFQTNLFGGELVRAAGAAAMY